jgi:hypothetical protein
MRLPAGIKRALRHTDRWRLEDMLREHPDMLYEDAARDMDLWRRMYAPRDRVRGRECDRESIRGACSRVLLGLHLVPRRSTRKCCRDMSPRSRIGSRLLLR